MYKFFVFFFIQTVAFQSIHCQTLGRVNYGANLPLTQYVSSPCQNQVTSTNTRVVSSAPLIANQPNLITNTFQQLPSLQYGNLLPATETMLSGPLPMPSVTETILPNSITAIPGPTTIIQDSTVSNNLVNALQLLAVSNLLGNTLSQSGLNEVVLPLNLNAVSSPSIVTEQIINPGYGNQQFVNTLPSWRDVNLPLNYNTISAPVVTEQIINPGYGQQILSNQFNTISAPVVTEQIINSGYGNQQILSSQFNTLSAPVVTEQIINPGCGQQILGNHFNTISAPVVTEQIINPGYGQQIVSSGPSCGGIATVSNNFNTISGPVITEQIMTPGYGNQQIVSNFNTISSPVITEQVINTGCNQRVGGFSNLPLNYNVLSSPSVTEVINTGCNNQQILSNVY